MLEDPTYRSSLLHLLVFSGRCSNQDLAEEIKLLQEKSLSTLDCVTGGLERERRRVQIA